MKEKPLVSIVIPTHNGGKLLPKAIESVLQQNYDNIEIIIIDDFSDGKDSEVILGLKGAHKRMNIFRNEKRFGFAKSLNKGIGKSKGKYIARIDDDDLWVDKNKIEKQVEFLEKNSEYVLVGGGVIVKSPDSDVEVIRYLSPKKNEDIKESLLVDNTFAHSSVVFLKSVFEKVGGYNEKFGFFSDWDLWLKMGVLGKLYNFQDYFVVYTDKECGPDNYFSRDIEIRRKLVLKAIMLWRYRKKYPGILKSLSFCFLSFIYSFFPFKNKLKVFLFKLRTNFIGSPYKYQRKNEN